jgi:hypothetical protein
MRVTYIYLHCYIVIYSTTKRNKSFNMQRARRRCKGITQQCEFIFLKVLDKTSMLVLLPSVKCELVVLACVELTILMVA